MVSKIQDAGYNHIARSKIERVTAYERHLIESKKEKVHRRRTTGTVKTPVAKAAKVNAGRKSMFARRLPLSPTTSRDIQPLVQATSVIQAQLQTPTTTFNDSPIQSRASTSSDSPTQTPSSPRALNNVPPTTPSSSMVRVDYVSHSATHVQAKSNSPNVHKCISNLHNCCSQKLNFDNSIQL